MSEQNTLADLCQGLKHSESKDQSQQSIARILENLSSRLSYVDQIKREDNDAESIQNLLLWISKTILPDSNCVSYDDPLNEETPASRIEAQHLTQRKALHGLKALTTLLTLSSQPKSLNPSILSILAFTNPLDPWTTPPIHALSTTLLSLPALKPHLQSPSFISTHLLQNFIRPLFLKSKKLETITPAGRQRMPNSAPAKSFSASDFDRTNQPWRYDVIYAITVLEWAVYNISPKDLSTTSLPLTLPPLLHLLDTSSTLLRHRALLILPHFFAKLTPPTLLATTGLGSVFSDAIYPILLSVPSLTPLVESELLLPAGYTALFALDDILYPVSNPTTSPNPNTKNSDALAHLPQKNQPQQKSARITSQTSILRRAILPAHLYTYPSHPSITLILLTQLTILIPRLDIHAIKHMQEIIPFVTEILGDPFAMIRPDVVAMGLRVLREVVLACWVRFAGVGVETTIEQGDETGNGGQGSARWRMEVLKSLLTVYTSVFASTSTSAIAEEEEIKRELTTVGTLLLAAVSAGDIHTSTAFKTDLNRLIEAEAGIAEVFGLR